MNRALRLAASTLALAFPMLAAHAADRARVLGPQEKVAGRSQADYAIAWWQWVMRLPDGVRAYQDPSGAQCAINQEGPVWFLAGTEGTMHARRDCLIPADTPVFVPVIAVLAHASPGKPLTCGQAQARVRATNDHLAQAQVLLDGEVVAHVPDHRLRTRCFDAFSEAKYIERHAPYVPAASDGYWLMLAPLPPGTHRLAIRARYDHPGGLQGDLEEVFEYQLRVGGTPAPLPRVGQPIST